MTAAVVLPAWAVTSPPIVRVDREISRSACCGVDEGDSGLFDSTTPPVFVHVEVRDRERAVPAGFRGRADHGPAGLQRALVETEACAPVTPSRPVVSALLSTVASQSSNWVPSGNAAVEGHAVEHEIAEIGRIACRRRTPARRPRRSRAASRRGVPPFSNRATSPGAGRPAGRLPVGRVVEVAVRTIGKHVAHARLLRCVARRPGDLSDDTPTEARRGRGRRSAPPRPVQEVAGCSVMNSLPASVNCRPGIVHLAHGKMLDRAALLVDGQHVARRIEADAR